jgi:5-methylcytosine-specific restriction endonuclease McrA
LHVSEKTDPRMLPQSEALEPQSADKPRGGRETGLRRREAPGGQHGREGRGRKAAVTPARGAAGVQRVFVLGKLGNPLMPCHPARARELLSKGRAVVVRYSPFVIRLKDRDGGSIQSIRLGVDPGSKTTGMAVSRDDGGVRHVMFRLEVGHRSAEIHKKMLQRAAYRRRRRSVNLRYRAPRFANRAKPEGWLAPSLRSRVQHVGTWARRFQRWVPVTAVDLELVRFDTQLMQDPEISGAEYQRGTLWGFEVREYLLEKFGRRCVYCGARDVPVNIDHVVPRSHGGSDRVSNLVLACVPCNQAKGSRDVREFAPENAARILARAKASLRDAAAVNSTRFGCLAVLRSLGVPVECWSGGRTKFNRRQFAVPKAHCLDAACTGKPAGVRSWRGPVLTARATGRGTHQRTRTDAYGFPRLRLPRSKRVQGFATGDLVRASVPAGKHAGRHLGRVAIRTRGCFRVGPRDGISYRRCVIVQRADGYDYATTRLLPKGGSGVSSPVARPGFSRRNSDDRDTV